MRSLAMGLALFVSLSGAALAAGPSLAPIADLLAPPSADPGAIEELAEKAGLSPGAPALPPVATPVDPDGFTIPWLGLGIGAGIASLALAGFLFGGARFVTPAEVLQNEVRQRIYAHLKAHMGANLKQVTDDLALTTTNAIWHLRKLEESGLIHSKRFNGYKIFYPAEGGIEARRLSLGKTALANDNAQEVFEHVVAHPGTHQREIARALGVNHGTVRWHLKKLMHAELVVETRRGKASVYEPTPVGLAALREVAGARVAPAPVAQAVTAA